jgi:hypothetical protein
LETTMAIVQALDLVLRGAGSLTGAPVQRSAGKAALSGGGSLAATMRGPWAGSATLAGNGGLDTFRVTNYFAADTANNPDVLQHIMATRKPPPTSYGSEIFDE